MAASTGSSLAWYLFAETERWAVSAKTRSAGQRLVGLLGTCGGLEPGGPVSFCGVWDPQKIHSVQRTAEDVEKVYTMCAQCGFEEQVTSVDNPTGSAWNISKKKKLPVPIWVGNTAACKWGAAAHHVSRLRFLSETSPYSLPSSPARSRTACDVMRGFTASCIHSLRVKVLRYMIPLVSSIFLHNPSRLGDNPAHS